MKHECQPLSSKTQLQDHSESPQPLAFGSYQLLSHYSGAPPSKPLDLGQNDVRVVEMQMPSGDPWLLPSAEPRQNVSLRPCAASLQLYHLQTLVSKGEEQKVMSPLQDVVRFEAPLESCFDCFWALGGL